jgi:hypothetical protein
VTALTLAAKNIQEQLLALQANIESIKGGVAADDPISDIDALVTIAAGKKEYHGVETIGAISTTVDAGEIEITLASITYWDNGVRHVISTPKTNNVTFANPNAYFYIFFSSGSEDLQLDVAWDIGEDILVATAYYNGTAVAIQREWHGYKRSIPWHKAHHSAIGALYGSGLDLTYPDASHDTSIQIEPGTIWDEDLESSTLAAVTNARAWYQASSGVYTFADVTRPYVGASGQPQWLDTDDYTLKDVGASDYIPIWVYFSNDVDRPIYIIPHQGPTAFNTANLAKAATPPDLRGLQFNPELRLIYRLIYKGDGQWQETKDYRIESSLPAGTLANISADNVTFSPYGNIAASTAGAAIRELDDEKMPLSYLDTDDTLAADSDSKVPSQQAVKAYVAANAGGGSSVIQADIAFYSSAAALPAATTTAVDGVTVTNGMKCLVIRSSTSGQINKIYSAAVSGTDITWTDAELFAGGSAPSQGEQVYILGGSVSKGFTYTYNGTGFGIPGDLCFTYEGGPYNAEDIMAREMSGYRYLRRIIVKHQTTIGGTSCTVAAALDGTAISGASVTINAGSLTGSADVTIADAARIAEGNVLSFDFSGTYTGGGGKAFIRLIFI